jgi:hypothetical protein
MSEEKTNDQKKYPDNVAWDEKEGWVGHKLPYASNVGAPAIKLDDTVGWKNQQVTKVNHQIRTKFEELKEEYNKLVTEFNWNQVIYKSTYSFIPVIGHTYHLYTNKDDVVFLSLIAPDEWNQNFIGSFKLDSTEKWIKVS